MGLIWEKERQWPNCFEGNCSMDLMHLSWWDIKWRIFFTSWLWQPDFSSVYLCGFIPTVFYSCFPPKKWHGNKEIILKSYSPAQNSIYGANTATQGLFSCTCLPNSEKRQSKWHHMLFSVSSDPVYETWCREIRSWTRLRRIRHIRAPLITFSDCNILLFPHWCYRDISFVLLADYIQNTINNLRPAGHKHKEFNND